MSTNPAFWVYTEIMAKKRYAGPNRRRPVLIIQHTPYEHAAAIRRALESQGIETRVVHPYDGEAYPKLSSIRGIISLGGPMGANDHDEHGWIEKECLLLREAVEAEMPVVGICLGAQLLARSLGSKVEKNVRPEIGWHTVVLNETGMLDRIVGNAGGLPLVYHWHFDTFHLPENAVLLGESRHCERQVFRIGDRVYGFQFHPEADHQLIGEWLAEDDIDEQIEFAMKNFGEETVQDRRTQREMAFEGEKASLRIVAGIGQLFQVLPYQPSNHPRLNEWRPKLAEWMQDKVVLEVTFEGSDRRERAIRGVALGSFSIPDGEFLILKEDTTLLWPLRLDYVQSIHPAGEVIATPKVRRRLNAKVRKGSKSKSPRPQKRSKK